MTKGKLKKGAYFTDIHFGRRNNSEDHNNDCMNFINWFISEVKNDKDIDHIGFLGDWHEHRSSINGQTLDYSYSAAKLLNDLGLPFYMIVGNHDLYFRNNRNIFTTNPFESLKNITLINEPLLVDDIYGKALFVPYLFHNEYDKLIQYKDIPVILGHLEFSGFVVTGEKVVMKGGPEHKDFFNKKIFSGHFHKRQNKDNVYYIGNTFPMDFSDANDNDRGMMIYDYEKDVIEFKNWSDCPKYCECALSDLLEGKVKILSNSRLKCLVDVEITYTESIELKSILTKQFKLKELFFEEQSKSDILKETDVKEDELNTQTTNELIRTLIQKIESDKIDTELLLKLYDEVK